MFLTKIFSSKRGEAGFVARKVLTFQKFAHKPREFEDTVENEVTIEDIKTDWDVFDFAKQIMTYPNKLAWYARVDIIAEAIKANPALFSPISSSALIALGNSVCNDYTAGRVTKIDTIFKEYGAGVISPQDLAGLGNIKPPLIRAIAPHISTQAFQVYLNEVEGLFEKPFLYDGLPGDLNRTMFDKVEGVASAIQQNPDLFNRETVGSMLRISNHVNGLENVIKEHGSGVVQVSDFDRLDIVNPNLLSSCAKFITPSILAKFAQKDATNLPKLQGPSKFLFVQQLNAVDEAIKANPALLNHHSLSTVNLMLVRLDDVINRTNTEPRFSGLSEVSAENVMSARFLKITLSNAQQGMNIEPKVF